MLRLALSVAAFSFVALLPGLAHAGSCPTCTTSADCMDPGGGPAFCVLHDRDVGCGTARQICCPGQGCSTMSGRPSCEGTTCMVVDGPATPDAAVAGTDAAVPAGTDAGRIAGNDAGAGMSTSGCGCRAAGSDPVSIALVALAGAALALRARRRR